MKFLFIYPPLGNEGSFFLPSGILVLSALLKQEGYEVNVINVDQLRLSDEEVLENIKKYSPDFIGWSAVTAGAYSYVKEMTKKIKFEYKKVPIFLGGNLCSVGELLLKNGIDIVFVLEAVVSLIKVIEKYKNNFDINTLIDFSDIGGLMYLGEEGNVICTGKPESLPDNMRVHLLPTDFEDIDIDYYIKDISFPDYYGVKNTNTSYLKYLNTGKKMISLMLNKGCQNSCTFCHRNSRYTVYDVDILIRYMIYLRDKYHVYYFMIASESFISNTKWILEFATKVKHLDIIFDIYGARVDLVSYEILLALKNSGMVAIFFGYESGSQAILDEMGKNVLVSDNYNAALLTRSLGIVSTPMLIIGYPGETISTLSETLRFIKKTKQYRTICNFLQPLPGTPIYHYALVNGS